MMMGLSEGNGYFPNIAQGSGVGGIGSNFNNSTNNLAAVVAAAAARRNFQQQ